MIDQGRLDELVGHCAASREWRRTWCDMLRTWYENGTGSGVRARYNKIRSHIDRVGSYLFMPGTARFEMYLPPVSREKWLTAAEMVHDEFRSTWGESGADVMISKHVEWSLVYGATIGKVQRSPGTQFRVGYIQPWDFGVSREDVPEMDEQDVMAHWYTLSVPQLERWLHGQPGADALIADAKAHVSTPGSGPAHSRLVVSGVSGAFPSQTITGAFPGDATESMDTAYAQVTEPVVPFVDLWERRIFRRRDARGKFSEEFEDWCVTTMIENGPVFLQRRNPDLPWTRTGVGVVLPAELPFFAVTPRPQTDYFWGVTELAALMGLQDWLDYHLTKMKGIIGRQLDPSKFFSGFQEFEEAGRALSTEGGSYGSSDVTGKMETIKVEVGQEAFTLYKDIKGMFADASGLPEMLEDGGQGGDPRNFSARAGIAGGRMHKMALMIEDSLGIGATKGLRIMQRHDDTGYPLPDGGKFLLAHLPPGTHLKVSAHTSAPIYAEQVHAKAEFLFKAKAISKVDLIELTDPPGREELKLKAVEIQKRDAETAREMIQIQHEKATKGARPAVPKK